MYTNPRDQKLTTDVAKAIAKSIENGSKNFHEKNRGIVMSVDKFSYDNKTGKIKVLLTDPEIHGNIDGGHTLKIILKKQKDNELFLNNMCFLNFLLGFVRRLNWLKLVTSQFK